MVKNETYREQLEDVIQNFNEEQMNSLLYYADVLNRAANNENGYHGIILREFINPVYRVIDSRTVEARMPVRWELNNIQGVLHGGTLATFIDISMGRSLRLLYPGKYTSQLTVGLDIHYLGTGKGKEVYAHIELLQCGRSVCVLDCKIYNEENKLVTVATGTFKIRNAVLHETHSKS
jgi:uncharacterized protein (TIGR00369 family)